MKSLFIIFIFSLFLPLFLNAKTEVLANAYEAKVMAKVKEEKSDKLRLEILLEAAKSEKAGAAIFFNTANLAAGLSDFKTALEFYKKALNLEPEFYLAKRNLAFLYYKEEKYEEASAYFAEALRLSNDDVLGISEAFASALISLKRYDEALTILENALIFDGKNLNLMRSKAFCLKETGQYDRLEKYAKYVLNLYPDEAVFWRLLARINLEKNNANSAIANLEALKKINAANAEDMILLGDVYLSLNLFSKALDAYKNQKISDDKSVRIAKYLIANSAISESKKILENLEKDSAKYWEIDALILKAEGKNSKESFEKSYKKDPLNAFIALSLADIALAEKQVESAKIYYKLAMKDYRLQSFVGLANVEILDGNYKAALKILKEANLEFNSKEIAKFIFDLEGFSDAQR